MDGDDHEGARAIDVCPQPVEDLHLVAHIERAGGFIQQQYGSLYLSQISLVS